MELNLEDMFMPNRGKKQVDKKTFELGDDFFPNRGRRLSGSTFHPTADALLFYPNRGKKSLPLPPPDTMTVAQQQQQ